MALTNRSTLQAFAETALPLMDDPRTFDGQPPQCSYPPHAWSIVHDQQVAWQDRYASGTITYPVAIVCAHCDFVLGFG